MITANQIKKELFMLMRKGIHEPALNDVVNEATLKKLLFTKYGYDLSDEEFNSIGDELADSGDFYWNNHGKLALGSGGLAHLHQTRS